MTKTFTRRASSEYNSFTESEEKDLIEYFNIVRPKGKKKGITSIHAVVWHFLLILWDNGVE